MKSLERTILHVCKNDKFIPQFIKFIEKNFDEDMHEFRVFGDLERYALPERDNVHTFSSNACSLQAYFSLVLAMYRAEKIILHGLFNKKVILILSLNPFLLKKCYWVMWGGDYLNEKKSRTKIRRWIAGLSHRFVVRNVGNLITYIPGSVDHARQVYGAKGYHHECLAYPSNTVKDEVFGERDTSHGKVKVLVGNSATESNQHFDLFNKIHPFVTDEVLLYAPLSYGDLMYAEKVIKEGRRLFGKQFIPMTELLSLDEYNRLLESIDIVLFNHNRQQAMGNTINFLGMGKEVYMRSDIPSWELLKNKNIKVHDINNFNGFSISEINADNQVNVRRYFSEKNLVSQWWRIFHGEC